MSVEVLLSNENLSIFGGPASIDVNVDFGPKGDRGSLIFSGPGKPTDLAVTFSTPPKPQDLYINLLPSDFEYLFLYQYGSVNGILTWSRVLRLIPNTAIANIPVIFLDGEARTVEPTLEGFQRVAILQAASPPNTTAPDVLQSIINGVIPVSRISPTEPSSPTSGMHWVDISNPLAIVMKSYSGSSWSTAAETAGPSNFWLDFLASPLPQLKRWTGSAWEILASIRTGLFFPISDYFSQEELAVGASTGFSVQYVILNENAINSGLSVDPLTTLGSKLYLPVFIKATETVPFIPGNDSVSWRKLNGVKNLSFVLVANIGTLPLF
jgi:hypothetical protein